MTLTEEIELDMGQDEQDVTIGELSRVLKSFIASTDRRFDILEKSTVSTEIYGLKTAQTESTINQVQKELELEQVKHEKDMERVERMAEQQGRQFQDQIDKLNHWRDTREELAKSHSERSKEEAVAAERKRNFRLAVLSVAAVLVSGGIGSLISLLVR